MAETIIDIERFRRARPALFRTPDEMAAMRIDADEARRRAAQVSGHLSATGHALGAPESLCAYAPDPDADYRQGRADERAAIEAEQLVEWSPAYRFTRTEQIIRGLIMVGLPLFVFVALTIHHATRGAG